MSPVLSTRRSKGAHTGIYWAIANTFVTWTLSQHNIVELRDRAQVGLFYGICISLLGSYIIYVGPYVRPLSSAVVALATLAAVFILYSFCKKKPLTARVENLTSLAAKIIQSSPQEGLFPCSFNRW